MKLSGGRLETKPKKAVCFSHNTLSVELIATGYCGHQVYRWV